MRAETEPSCMPFFRALLRLAVSVFLATGACAFPVRAEPLSFAMERMMLPSRWMAARTNWRRFSFIPTMGRGIR